MQLYLFFTLPADFSEKKLDDQIEITLFENNSTSGLTQVGAKQTSKLSFLEVGYDNEKLQIFLRDLFGYDHGVHFSKILV